MKKTKIAMVVFDTFQPAGVQKEYAYRTNIKLKADDLCVVEVQNNQFKVVQVVAMVDINLANAQIVNKATKYIVDKVDLTAHIDRVTAAERMTFIKAQLEERKAKMEEVTIYEMLAAADPEARKLLNEMKQLTLDS